ncbi:mechanosensitive ion channel family protein [Cyanobium sp. Morenito 9A2]|uniref:mechanosensitive ion channel family protein n=1 Tax=Cyanobium sp. Morenito 9A2 TaxID=2823718 RepID=UPI0020CE246A|nr:mechanosensitive ion channel domain-containing protein [Cyanobium sp. Morenito 9A2]MCP9848467.1 mechanosensitive ion channel [Cyanobium sp. Morenito 9A2]
MASALLTGLARLAAGLAGLGLAHLIALRLLQGVDRRDSALTERFILDRLEATALGLAGLGVVLWAWSALPLDGLADRLVEGLVQLLVVVLVVRLLNRILLKLLTVAIARVGDATAVEGLMALAPMLRFILWVLGLLVFLQNQGVRLTAVVGALAGAGLGIGFALQGPAKDVINYLTILFDRPFEIGQLIRFDDVWGRVSRVGLRSTQLRSLDGERVVINNADLLGKTLRNYSDVKERRVLQRFTLHSSTRAEDAASVAGLVREAVRSVEGGRFDRSHLIELTERGLVFEICYYLPGADPLASLDAQERVNLHLLERMAGAELRFAEPPQAPGA